MDYDIVTQKKTKHGLNCLDISSETRSKDITGIIIGIVLVLCIVAWYRWRNTTYYPVVAGLPGGHYSAECYPEAVGNFDTYGFPTEPSRPASRAEIQQRYNWQTKRR